MTPRVPAVVIGPVVAMLSACGTAPDRDCPDVKLEAISVRPVDAETGRPVVNQWVRAAARDGKYTDQGSSRDGLIPLALDRAGTYQVQVEARGYQPWSRAGVHASRGRCAVLPVIVRARLHRWPDPDTLPQAASAVTDTVKVPVRTPLLPGSPERARLVNWIYEPTPFAFTFRIGLGPQPGRLRVTTTLQNLGKAVNAGGPPRRELAWGVCSFVLSVYRSSDLQGAPAWDSRTWALSSRAAGTGWFCPSIAIMPELLPEDPVPGQHLDWDGHMMDILGDSLPEGRYYFQAQIGFRGDTLRLSAGDVALQCTPRPSNSGRARPDSATVESGSTSSSGRALPLAPPTPP